VAGRVSASIIEQVRQASDIADVISTHVSLKRAGRSLKGLCPFHKEKTPSFHVTPDKQVFHCFGCGVGGDVFKFVQLRENVDFAEALSILANRAGIELDRTATPQRTGDQPGKSELERVNRWACQWFQRELKSDGGRAASEYVARRGVCAESAERFALGFAPDDWQRLCGAARNAGIAPQLLVAAGLAKQRDDGSLYDAFRNRLVFPIRDAMDRTIGFGGRTLGDDPAKYLNSPQGPLFDKSRCLYGLATAREALSRTRTAVVVEGYTDCVLAQQHGFDNTVATLGTALTAEHVTLLHRYVDQVVLVFDSDDAGQRAADNALQLLLSERLDVKIACVPEAKDPAELLVSAGSEAFRRTLTSATDALEFKWNQVFRRYRGAETGPDRRRAVEEFLGLVAGLSDFGDCDPIQRGLMLNQVGKLLGLPIEEVNRQLRIAARRTPAPRRQDGPVGVEAEGRPRSAAAAAMRNILEVLLNEPEHYGAATPVFDPELLPDHDGREIARAVQVTLEEGSELSLPVLISTFDSVQTAGLITRLQLAGEKRGNYAATVEGAVACLTRLREHRRLGRWIEELRVRDAEGPGLEGSEEQTKARAMGEVVRQTRHFAAPKHVAS
jgi:DNA primase